MNTGNQAGNYRAGGLIGANNALATPVGTGVGTGLFGAQT